MVTNTSRLPLMWRPHGMEGGRLCVCVYVCAPQYFVPVCVCVWAGGAECPLLSKQQKCHPSLVTGVGALEISSNPRARL